MYGDTAAQILQRSCRLYNAAMYLKASRPSLRLCLDHVASPARVFFPLRSLHSKNVPPESHSFIRLPQPPQSDELKPFRNRGYLPIPRELFTKGNASQDMQPPSFQRMTPRSSKARQNGSKAQKWKVTMARFRRVNLEDGLAALWNRKLRVDRTRNVRITRKFLRHNEASAAPEKEDDRLTRPTILESLTEVVLHPDPERFSRNDRSRNKVLALGTFKREARRDALMELYISASDFIVHENELKTAIEDVFAEDYFQKQRDSMNRHGAIENAWGVFGEPASVSNMIESTIGSSTKVMDFDETEHDKSVKRAKRIADDLTGGKMA